MYFNLSLLQNNQQIQVGNTNFIYIPFTDFNSNIKNKVFQNTSYDNNSYYSYSFDEHLQLHKNAKAELTFKMYKYVNLESEFCINPFVNNLKTGSIIVLTTNNQNKRFFWLNKISYKFSKNNIEYSYSSQDLFSYLNTRKNSGFEIKNDKNSVDFIGVKTVDQWAQWIEQECNMDYHYVPILPSQYNDNEDSLININTWKNIDRYQDYNRSIIFSVSNSNAYNALVSLGSEAGLIIEVDDVLKKFWFRPEKNPNFNGLRYSPYNDLKDFSLSQSGDSLITVLNVFGQSVNDENISLLSDMPEKCLELFNQQIWDEQNYYPGMYKNLTGPRKVNEELKEGLLWNYVEDPNIIDSNVLVEGISDQIQNFLTVVDQIPWLENKLINFEYFYKNKLISDKNYKDLWDLLTNKLRKVNGHLLYWQHQYFSEIQKSTNILHQIDTRIQNYFSSFMSDIISRIEKEKLKPGDFEDKFPYSWDRNYKLLWESNIDENREFYNFNEQVSLYGTKLVNAQQLFLKNIYLFKKKLDEVWDEIKDKPINTWATFNNNWYQKSSPDLNDKDDPQGEKENENFQEDHKNHFITHIKRQLTTDLDGKIYFNCGSNNNLINNKVFVTMIDNSNNSIDFTFVNVLDFEIKYNEIREKGLNSVAEIKVSWDKNYLVLDKLIIGDQAEFNDVGKIIQYDIDLTRYWSIAKRNSYFCSYYIPTNWKIEKSKTDHCLDINKINQYIPNINCQIIFNTNTNNKLYKDYIYEPQYNKNSTNNKSIAITELLINYQLPDFKKEQYEWQGKGEPLLREEWYTVTSGGITWNEVPGKWGIKHNLIDNKELGGLYNITLQYLLTYYQASFSNDAKNNYEQYKKQHNDVWKEIFQKYSNYIIESNYEDKISWDAMSLYQSALNYFRDLSNPETQYNLSLINMSHLKGYIVEDLKISDQIQINADDFYDELDDLKDVIRQPLFITDINYNLRSDEDIKITVNAIKYQDKVIQRLVSLIK